MGEQVLVIGGRLMDLFHSNSTSTPWDSRCLLIFVPLARSLHTLLYLWVQMADIYCNCAALKRHSVTTD